MNFNKYVLEQIERHPSMQPQDLVKLCFQAAFGAEHLLADHKAAREYLENNRENRKVTSANLTDYLGKRVYTTQMANFKKPGRQTTPMATGKLMLPMLLLSNWLAKVS